MPGSSRSPDRRITAPKRDRLATASDPQKSALCREIYSGEADPWPRIERRPPHPMNPPKGVRMHLFKRVGKFRLLALTAAIAAGILAVSLSFG